MQILNFSEYGFIGTVLLAIDIVFHYLDICTDVSVASGFYFATNQDLLKFYICIGMIIAPLIFTTTIYGKQ